MVRMRACVPAIALLTSALCARPARAAADEDVTSVRALGMADALRAAGVGAAGIHLNPSGLALVRSYTVEGSYEFLGPDNASYIDLAVADSVTSRVGGGVYFDYVSADARDATGMKLSTGREGWESGAAVSLPLSDAVFLGVTTKYQSIDQPVGGKADGFTVDVGTTIRPASFLTIAAVGANLIEQKSTRAPREFAVGAAVMLGTAVLLDFDTVFDYDTARLTGRGDQTDTRYHAGGELLLGQRLALRAGYLRNDGLSQTYIAYGGSIVAQQAAIDFGAHTQVDGPGEHGTLFGVSLRLFLQ
jgi:hypothetical protein